MDADRPAGATLTDRPDTATSTRPGAGVIITLVALSVLLVALVVASVFLYLKVRDARDDQERDDAIVAAARKEALAFTDFDYRKIDEQIEAVLAGSTGEFHAQFKARADDLRDLSKENESVAEGEILESGLIPSNSGTHTVLIVADGTVSNANTKTPQPRHYRLSLDMVQVDGVWKTAKLEFVG